MERRAVLRFLSTTLLLAMIGGGCSSAELPTTTTTAAAASDIEAEVLRRTLPAYGLMMKSAEMALHGDEVDYSYDDGEAEDREASSICQDELEIFRRAVDDRTPWALKMLDSSGVPRSGFVYGNNYWLGSRSQCLDLANTSPLVLRSTRPAATVAAYESPPFRPNYLVAHFRHNSSLQLHVRLPNEDLVTLGLCLPSSCPTGWIGRLLEAVFRERQLSHGRLYAADFRLELVRDLRDDRRWLLETRQLLVECALAFLLALVCLGTAYDVLLRRKRRQDQECLQNCKKYVINNNERLKLNHENSGNVETGRRLDPAAAAAASSSSAGGAFGQLLLSFSVPANSRLIFGTRLGPDSIGPIHGIRFLGMVWIVMIHTIFYMSDYADNKAWSWRMAEGFAVQIISNSTLSVDTFFFLSGFLVAYMYFTSHRAELVQEQQQQQEVETASIPRRKRIDYGRKCGEFVVTVLRRFIRLTPAYVMMIGLLQVNSSWYARTSQFYMTERPHVLCERYWWRNILYINNLFGRDTMCMSWSWYLSNDMQFFVIGTFLLILSSVFFYLAASILMFLLIGSIAITGYIAYVNDYIPTMDEQYNMLDVLYDPPWTRIGPYLVGMITAYVVTRLDGKLHLSRRSIAVLWILGSSCNLSVLFGLYERQIDVLTAAFYVALSRTVWAVGLSWLLIACCTGHAGIVNKILCFKAWIPLSRLTYCAYLLNPFIINSIYLHSESAVHVDFLPNSTIFFGSLVITYLCSYALSLMLETPTVVLMRHFVNAKKR